MQVALLAKRSGKLETATALGQTFLIQAQFPAELGSCEAEVRPFGCRLCIGSDNSSLCLAGGGVLEALLRPDQPQKGCLDECRRTRVHAELDTNIGEVKVNP